MKNSEVIHVDMKLVRKHLYFHSLVKETAEWVKLNSKQKFREISRY